MVIDVDLKDLVFLPFYFGHTLDWQKTLDVFDLVTLVVFRQRNFQTLKKGSLFKPNKHPTTWLVSINRLLESPEWSSQYKDNQTLTRQTQLTKRQQGSWTFLFFLGWTNHRLVNFSSDVRQSVLQSEERGRRDNGTITRHTEKGQKGQPDRDKSYNRSRLMVLS